MQNKGVLLASMLAILFLPFWAEGQSSGQPAGEAVWVEGKPYRLFGRIFFSKKLTLSPVLVVVLHGDAPPPYEHPVYQNIFASQVAAANQNVVAAGLLRPGYTDADGNHSEGDQGIKNGDNWNAKNTDAIASAIGELRQRYKAGKVVVAAHSGGAAITANILGRHPDLIDAALLVSCPCGEVDDWRQSMLELTGLPVFEGKIHTLSPLAQVEGISGEADITLMVGTQDSVTPPRFSEQYQKSASSLGKSVRLFKLKGQPHNTFLEPEVLTRLAAIIKRMQEPEQD